MITKRKNFNGAHYDSVNQGGWKQAEELYGLSTDTKPDNVKNATTFYEMDTRVVYMFDEQNKQWIPQ